MAKLLADECIADCAELTNLAASIVECKELAAKVMRRTPRRSRPSNRATDQPLAQA